MIAVTSQSQAIRRAPAAEMGPSQGIQPGATGFVPNSAW